MLVSVAFNFLGFVLTYLLHTTHAAKFGSRAGLGITLIQYGWALRSRAENSDFPIDPSQDDGSPVSVDVNDASAWGNNDSSLSSFVQPAKGYAIGENAAAWLSFSLMTIGKNAITSFQS